MRKLLVFFLFLIIFLSSSCTGLQNLNQGDVPEPDFIQSSEHLIELEDFDFSDRNVKFDFLDIFSGMSSNIVNDIYQDQFGLVWIATVDGLNKYDGKEFTVYNREANNPGSLTNNSVSVIFEDSYGELWIGTDGGLELFDRANDSFIHFRHDPADATTISNNFVKEIYEDSNGNLWIGTVGGGLNRFERDSQTFTSYTHLDSDPYSLASNIVHAIYEDSRGYLWIGTWNGLDRFDFATENFFHFREEVEDSLSLYMTNIGRGIKGFDTLADVSITMQAQYDLSSFLIGNKIIDIEEDIDGSLWIGTLGSGIRKFDPFSGSFSEYLHDQDKENSLSDNTVLDIFRDEQDNFWFGTNDGLNLYDRQDDEFVVFHHDETNSEGLNNLSNEIVNTVFQDHSGMFWIGTSGGGINTFSPSLNRFEHIKNNPNRPSSLSSDSIWAFQEDYDGMLWVANDKGVDLIRPAGKYFIHYDPHSDDIRNEDDKVFAILRDSKGMLWIGTSRGISRFNYTENKFITFTSYQYVTTNVTSPLSEINITALHEDAEGNIWMGTYGFGLLKLTPSAGLIYEYMFDQENPQSLGSNIVTSIVRDKNGFLWIGTIGGGLNQLDPKTDVITRHLNSVDSSNSISDNSVSSILLQGEEDLWIGTYNGLDRLDLSTGDFTSYSIKDGLPSDYIASVVIDEEGLLWVSTGSGISRFNADLESFINYTYRDGLQTGEFINGSALRGRDGALYFGGTDGYNKFYPNELVGNSYSPPIVLSSLTRSGNPIDLDLGLEEVEAITIRWPDNYFEFEFSALSYIQSHKNEYAYTLENFDTSWNYVGSRAYGRYTNLPPGDYVLRMIGSNNDGVWNTSGKSLQIRVIPAWWESQWFRISGILLIALAILSVYRLQIGNIERYNRKLAEDVQERTRDIEKRRKVSDGLREILIRLNSSLPVTESIDFIACQVSELLTAKNVYIFKLKGESRASRIAIFPAEPSISDSLEGLKEVSSEIPSEVIEQVALKIRSQKDITLQKYNLDTGEQDTYTGVPIFLGGNIYGGMIIEHGEIEIRHEELELLKSFADQVGLAIGNESLRTRAEDMAIVSERNRIARDLHDAITQTLFSANLMAETISEVWKNDRKKALKIIDELRQLNQSALAEMRTLLLELKPASVIETDMEELLGQLANVLRGRAGCKVQLEIEGRCKIPDNVHVSLYRIAQEAATNIMKHANAENVHIQLKCLPGLMSEGIPAEVKLSIEDDGMGFKIEERSASRFGVSNMHQRASSINADLEVISGIGEGTRIIVSWKQGKEN